MAPAIRVWRCRLKTGVDDNHVSIFVDGRYRNFNPELGQDTSESTRAFGHPNEMKPTFLLAVVMNGSRDY